MHRSLSGHHIRKGAIDKAKVDALLAYNRSSSSRNVPFDFSIDSTTISISSTVPNQLIFTGGRKHLTLYISIENIQKEASEIEACQ
jgi:hypothetical protein